MQSDKQKTPNSDLHSVQIDGDKPSHDGSRVRSLLGIPESEGGNLAFSPTSLPVGFRYANGIPPEAPYLTTQPQFGRQSQDVAQEKIQPRTPIEEISIEREGASEVSQARVVEKESGKNMGMIKDTVRQHGVELESKQEQVTVELTEKSEKLDANIEQPNIEIPNVFEKNQAHLAEEKTAQNKGLIRDVVRQHDVEPESKQEQGAVEPTYEFEKPGASIEQPSIEIPGVSEKKQSFPKLSQTKKGDTPSHKIGVRVQQEAPSAGTRNNFVRANLSEAEENVPMMDSMMSSEGLQKAEGVKEKLTVTPSPSGRESTVTGDVDAVKDDVKTAIKHKLSSQREEFLHVEFEEKSKSKTPQSPGAFASQSVDADTVNRSNRDAAERIEQLRQTVHELASKVSSLQASPKSETRGQQPEQTPTPPTQPVVIINRSSNEDRTPSAFWERSYLSRCHLRTLR